MSEESVGASGRTPWHLWVVGVAGALWSSVGAFDYFMTQTENEAYMANFSPEQLEFFYNFPSWVVAFWGRGRVGGCPGLDRAALSEEAGGHAPHGVLLGHGGDGVPQLRPGERRRGHGWGWMGVHHPHFLRGSGPVALCASDGGEGRPGVAGARGAYRASHRAYRTTTTSTS